MTSFAAEGHGTALVLGVIEAVQAATIFQESKFNPAVWSCVNSVPPNDDPLTRVTDASSPGTAPVDWHPRERSDPRLDAVVKRFGDNEVLRGISLNLHRHEVVCLIGASGSGKSTLLRCVNLLETIDGGTITLFGQSLTDVRIDSDRVRRHTGMVFQSFNLFPHLSVLENVLVGPVRALKRKRSDVLDEALQLLERIGLRDRADEYPTGSRAANNNASRSYAPSRCDRHCSCSTKSPARSTVTRR